MQKELGERMVTLNDRKYRTRMVPSVMCDHKQISGISSETVEQQKPEIVIWKAHRKKGRQAADIGTAAF